MSEPAAHPLLVGRSTSLERVKSALERHPGLLVVSGDAGSGKTTLITEACGDSERLVLQGSCFPRVSEDLPYSPFVQAFRRLRRGPLLSDLPDAARKALSPLLGETAVDWDERGRWAKSRLYETTLDALDLLVRRGPVVLVLEDLHWADQATLELVQFLVGNLPTDPIGLVLTHRSNAPGAPEWLRHGLQWLDRADRITRIHLTALTDHDARDLVSSVAPHADSDAVDRIVRRGAGNPLFLRELAAVPTTPGTAVPPRLQELLQLQMAPLSDAAQRLVRTLAVAGSPVHHKVLASLDPRHDAAARDAVQANLVLPVDDHRLGLRHALLGEVVYDGLLPHERADLHRVLAQAFHALAGDAAPEDDHGAVEAFHWEHAGLLDRAVPPLVEAAQTALRRCAFVEALRAWEKVLQLWPHAPPDQVPTRADMLASLALARRFGGQPAEGIEPLRSAIQLVSGRRRAELLEQLSRHYHDLSQSEEALHTIREASTIAGDNGDPGLVARVEATYAALLMIRGEYAESRRRCETVIAATSDRDHLWERAHALRVLGVDLINMGELDTALETMALAMDSAAALHDPEPTLRTYVNLSYVLEYAGQWNAAVSCTREGLQRANDVGLGLVLGPMLWANQASALMALGRLEEAREALQFGIDTPGTPAALQYAELLLVEVEAGLGDTDAAEGRFDRLQWDDPDDATSRSQHALSSAVVAVAGSRPRQAVKIAVDHLSSVAGSDPVVGMTLAVLGLHALARAVSHNPPDATQHEQDRADADTILQAAETIVAGTPLPRLSDLIEVARLEHRSLNGRDDPNTWETLARRLQDHGTHALATRAWLRAAQVRAAISGPRSADAALRAAYLTQNGLGPSALRQEIIAFARYCRVTLDSSPNSTHSASKHTTAGLTRREIEVLRAIWEGASNRQIARRLGISERTVGVHVGNILAKLNARNRTDAVRVANNLGVITMSS